MVKRRRRNTLGQQTLRIYPVLRLSPFGSFSERESWSDQFTSLSSRQSNEAMIDGMNNLLFICQMEVVVFGQSRFGFLYSRQSRIRNKVVSACQKQSVFQLYPRKGRTTLYDVEDAIEACAICRDTNSRKECFEIFGLDSQKVDVYYHIAKRLEQSIQYCKRSQSLHCTKYMLLILCR